MVALALSLMLCAAPGTGPQRIEFPGKVERGDSVSFTARRLVPGRNYLFLATGICIQVQRGGGHVRTVKRPYADASVVGFSAQIAGGPEHPLAAGPNVVNFVAPSRDVVIKVFDKGIPTSHRCTFDWFAVEGRKEQHP